jgi:hypothetical protein
VKGDRPVTYSVSGPKRDGGILGSLLRVAVVALALMGFLSSALAASDVFVTVPFRASSELNALPSSVTIRHISDGWALIQSDTESVHSLPVGSRVVAPVLAHYDYYWVGGLYGEPEGLPVLLRWRNYALVAAKRGDDEPVERSTAPHGHILLAPDVSRASLFNTAAPRTVATLTPDAVLNSVVEQFDSLTWLNTVATLADNYGTQSRYSRRVRQAVHTNGHPLPDDACDRAADWIADRLRSLGYEPEFDPFMHTIYSTNGEKVAEYGMRNVIATKPGRGVHRNRLLLLTAHYDSKATNTEGWEEHWRDRPAPGAVDNATGVATLLEAARLFADLNLDYTVRFVFFSGEELGLFGSRHYAKLVSQRGDDLLGVLNVDMLGFDGDGTYDVHVLGDMRSQWMLRLTEAVAARYAPHIVVKSETNPDWVFSDHAPFWAEGYSGLVFAEETDFDAKEFYPFYHSVDDMVIHMTPDFGYEAARFYIATAVELAGVLVAEGPSSVPVVEKVSVVGASAFPNPFVVESGKPLRIQYQLNRAADVRVEVFDTKGDVLFAQSFASDSVNGRYGLNAPVVWDGKNADGEAVPPGIYIVAIGVRDATGAVNRRTLRVVVVPSDAYLDKYKKRLSPKP